MADKHDLKLYRGDSWERRFALWADDGVTPIDLTGAAVAAQFRDRFDGVEVVDFTTTVELPNTVLVEVTPAMWDTAPAGGVWDLQVTVAGTVTTVVAGKVTVTLDVTVGMTTATVIAPPVTVDVIIHRATVVAVVASPVMVVDVDNVNLPYRIGNRVTFDQYNYLFYADQVVYGYN